MYTKTKVDKIYISVSCSIRSFRSLLFLRNLNFFQKTERLKRDPEDYNEKRIQNRKTLESKTNKLYEFVINLFLVVFIMQCLCHGRSDFIGFCCKVFIETFNKIL